MSDEPSSAFYQAKPDRAFRLGDVVTGFILGVTDVDTPSPGPVDYSVRIRHPRYASIVTPCCSVGDKTLALAPLMPIKPEWLRNPYLAQDLLRVNSKMTFEQAVPPHLSPAEKERRRALHGERSFAFYEYFVYAPHASLPSYLVKHGPNDTEISYYIIDFRMIHRIESKSIGKGAGVPIEAKVLQLSVSGRQSLREKLAHYFGRAPQEDQA